MELDTISSIRQQAEVQSTGLKLLTKATEESSRMVRLVENLPSAPNAPGIGINIDEQA